MFAAGMDQTNQQKMNEKASRWKDVLPDDQAYRDISFEAAWSLSSCKAEGYGIMQLLSPRMDSYWQSDGPQPHIINIEFQKKMDICFVLLYLDIKVDESYTPSKIVIQKGSSVLDLTPIKVKDYSDPSGWEILDLREPRTNNPARAFVLQIHILSNHQNGRDTHIRGVKVIGPGPNRGPIDYTEAMLTGTVCNETATKNLVIEKKRRGVPSMSMGMYQIRLEGEVIDILGGDALEYLWFLVYLDVYVQ